MSEFAVSAVMGYRGQLLLARRPGTPPTWAFPGGHVQPHEHLGDAIRREVLEETHLICDPVALLAELEITTPSARYALFVFGCHLRVRKPPIAGDDASAVRWISCDKLLSEPLAPGMQTTLRVLHLIPAAS